MEDIKKRLEFGNPHIQEQAIWKLYSDILRKTPNVKITASTPEIAELKLLWEVVSGDKATLARAASTALRELVTSQSADFTYILNGFLNIIPSARSLGGVTTVLGELLVMQALAIEDITHEYHCPYTLRAPTHPYITLLANRPASWPLLLAEIEAIFSHPDSRVQKLCAEIFRPFIKFVLLEPTPSHPESSLQRLRLQQLLIQAFAKTGTRHILCTLLDALPCYQINSFESVVGLVSHVRELLALAGPRNDTCRLDEVEISRVTHAAVCLLLPCVQNKVDIQGLVDSLLETLHSHPRCMVGDVYLAELSHVLMTLGSFSSLTLLQLVDKVVSASCTLGYKGVAPAMLVLPLLQFLAAPKIQTERPGTDGIVACNQRKMVTSATSALFTVDKLIGTGFDKPFQSPVYLHHNLCAANVQNQLYIRLMSAIVYRNGDVFEWVSFLHQHLSGEKEAQNVSSQLTCYVVTLLLVHRNDEVTRCILDILLHIARLDNAKAPLFFPLLLYCLGKESVPEMKLAILEHIPKMAQHKFCIAPILKTLQALIASPKLCPVAIRLMTSLWETQDRCFPQLLKAIGEDDSSSFALLPSTEFLLAKASAVRDICRLKPEQHGEALLELLSMILRTATNNEGAAPSALALEGLYYLCEAEVIDIQSSWGVLNKQLRHDKRSVVIEKICQLFSLAPSLAVKSPEYERFQSDCVSSLWLYAESADFKVRSAAFQALAAYSIDDFKVSHLPQQVCEDLHQQTELMRQQQENPSLSVDDVFTTVPGTCFTRLLQLQPEDVLQDFESFLGSIVGKEVENLPRGIFHSTSRRHGFPGSHDAAISNIPAFVSTLYEKTRQPGLRPSLAVSLLFCYDPPVEVGRDGRPRNHYLIKRSKQFLDMFKTLLNEVPVQPSEWHRTILIPQAWISFTDRLFNAVVESRRAELDLQLKHGHISGDQLQEKGSAAWLFARDSLVDILKGASRGNPSQQSNAVLALTGVIICASQFMTSLDADAVKESNFVTEHLSHAHWMNVAVDSVLFLRDVQYQPRGKLLGLCQQKLPQDRVAPSTLTQATASICMAPMISCLITSDTDRVFYILQELTQCLPGGAKASDVPILGFHIGLGLGSVLGKLFEEHFSDISGKKGMMELWKSMGALEDCCLDQTNSDRAGCFLGLGLALTGLCQEGQTDSRVHVTTMHEKLTILLDQIPADHSSYQALCFCLACVTGTAYAANILPLDHVNAVLHQLEMAHEKHQQVTGISLALGMLCYSLSKMGHPGVSSLRQKFARHWLGALRSQEVGAMEKVAALNGLMSLIGSEQTLIMVQPGVSLTLSDIKVSEVIQVITQIVNSYPELGIQCNAVWMLGHLYQSACTVSENRTSVPPSYSYLPETSLLRAVMDLLIEAGKKGPELVPANLVKVALTCLQDEVNHVFPPVNWASVLSPLLRMQFGDNNRCLCLKLAVSQSGFSPTAAMFLSSWLTPPLFMTLNDQCKEVLFKSLPRLIKSVPASVISTFLERSCILPFLEETFDPQLAVCVLQGLTQALKVPDPPEAITSNLFQAVERFYFMIPISFHSQMYGNMAECLSNIPDEVFDTIMTKDYSLSDTYSLRGFYCGCYLVASNSQPITLLNGLIDSAMNNPSCSQDTLLYILTHCFWLCVRHNSEKANTMVRLNWIMELLGHTRNIATKAVPLSSPTQSLSQVVEFSVSIVALALTLLTSSHPSPEFGLDLSFLNVSGSKAPKVKLADQEPSQILGIPAWSQELKYIFLQHLPAAVLRFECIPWDQILPKVFDWLFTMNDLPDEVLSSDYKHSLKASLLMLRHSVEFRKATSWTKIVAHI